MRKIFYFIGILLIINCSKTELTDTTIGQNNTSKDSSNEFIIRNVTKFLEVFNAKTRNSNDDIELHPLFIRHHKF